MLLFEMIIHYSIVIGIYVKIPSLLPSILGRSTLYERPLQIYMGVAVLLLPLKYPATQKVRSTNVKIQVFKLIRFSKDKQNFNKI